MILEEIYYKFKLNTFLMNYSKDPIICDMLSACLNSGIKTFNGGCSLIIEFNNGVEAGFWNENKYYAWLSNGWFKKNNKVLYSYRDRRVSAKLMFRLEQDLKEHLLKSLTSKT